MEMTIITKIIRVSLWKKILLGSIFLFKEPTEDHRTTICKTLKFSELDQLVTSVGLPVKTSFWDQYFTYLVRNIVSILIIHIWYM